MTILLIGSAALAHHGRIITRKPLDVDMMSTPDEFFAAMHTNRYRNGAVVKNIITTPSGAAVIWHGGAIWDCEFLEPWGDKPIERMKAPVETHASGCETDSGIACTVAGLEGAVVPSIDFLYMLKMSHRYVKNSKHFNKTMSDIRFMRYAGASIPDELSGAYQERMRATYNYGHPKLNVNKAAFFKEDVPYKYDHDSIHVAVAIDGAPAYTRYIVDGAEVQTSRDKFEALDFKTRLNGVLEESYVLALERSVIPHSTSPRKAFMMALEKVCTSITSGWFREFAWEHYQSVVNLYDIEGGDYYVQRFEAGLAAGIVKPHTGTAY